MRCIASSLADMRILLFCALTFCACMCECVYSLCTKKDRLTVLPFVEIEYYGIRFDAKRNTIIRFRSCSPKNPKRESETEIERIYNPKYKNDYTKKPTNVSACFFRFFSSDLTKLVFRRDFYRGKKLFTCIHIRLFFTNT